MQTTSNDACEAVTVRSSACEFGVLSIEASDLKQLSCQGTAGELGATTCQTVCQCVCVDTTCSCKCAPSKDVDLAMADYAPFLD